MCASDYAMGPLFKTVRESNPNGAPASQAECRQLVGFFVNGYDIEDIIRVVIKFYDDNWFSKVENHKTQPN